MEPVIDTVDEFYEEDLWEVEISRFDVYFSLPLDEMTEHFEKNTRANRHNPSSMSGLINEIEVNPITDGKHARAIQTLPYWPEFLGIEPAGDNGQEPSVKMKVSFALTYEKLRSFSVEQLLENAIKAEVLLRAYYPDPFPAKLVIRNES